MPKFTGAKHVQIEELQETAEGDFSEQLEELQERVTEMQSKLQP